jgi:antagonist of KipI
MNTLQVNSHGLLTTVQDLGREGYGPLGVSASGAADSISLRLGNLLVGNTENAAALEMTLLGGEFQFAENTVIAVTGSDFVATLEGKEIASYKSVSVGAGKKLRFGPTRSGARCYLCVQGGLAVNEFLGSRSTHLLSGLGGFEGRALRKGDVLPIGDVATKFKQSCVSAQAQSLLTPRKILRVTEGPQWSSFSDPAKRQFFEQEYAVSEETNRMGIRLQSAPLEIPFSGEMITEGVSLGAIQIPPGGQPIILFVEQQTTGGYPKLANVVSADLYSLGQLRPRDEIRFELVTQEAARASLLHQERLLASTELVRNDPD